MFHALAGIFGEILYPLRVRVKEAPASAAGDAWTFPRILTNDR
jgi:hypothetical protein